jgi:MFS family permease
MKTKFLEIMPAFRYRNYRIFFSAQIISLTGYWLQQVAMGYLVFQITHSAFMVGLMTAIAQLPALFFTLIGGVIIDRFPKKQILLITQICHCILATLLGILTITGNINLFSLGAITFLIGLVQSVDQPARHAVIVDLVNKEDLHAATATNMSIFNSARIIGPTMAGWLILAFGVGWAFLLNGLSYLAPILAYNFIRFTPHIHKAHKGTLHAITEGLQYAATHKIIRLLLMYLAMVSIFGWSYTVIIPVIAEQVFQQGPRGLGYLYSAAGLGSVIGAISVSMYTKKFSGRKLVFYGGLLYAIAIIGFSFTYNFNMALFLLFLTGFGTTTQNSTIQATIQHEVEDNFRGRVSSIQSLVLMGLHPIGSFQVGTIAEHYGSQIAVRLGGIALFLSAILLYLKSPRRS